MVVVFKLSLCVRTESYLWHFSNMWQWINTYRHCEPHCSRAYSGCRCIEKGDCTAQ